MVREGDALRGGAAAQGYAADPVSRGADELGYAQKLLPRRGRGDRADPEPGVRQQDHGALAALADADELSQGGVRPHPHPRVDQQGGGRDPGQRRYRRRGAVPDSARYGLRRVARAGCHAGQDHAHDGRERRDTGQHPQPGQHLGVHRGAGRCHGAAAGAAGAVLCVCGGHWSGLARFHPQLLYGRAHDSGREGRRAAVCDAARRRAGRVRDAPEGGGGAVHHVERDSGAADAGQPAKGRQDHIEAVSGAAARRAHPHEAGAAGRSGYRGTGRRRSAGRGRRWSGRYGAGDDGKDGGSGAGATFIRRGDIRSGSGRCGRR